MFAGAIEAGGYVGAVVMPGGAGQTRKELDGWQEWARARGARGLAYVLLDAASGEARGPVAKNLSEAHLAGLANAVGAKPGDAVFFAASTVAAGGAGAARRRPVGDRPAGGLDRRERVGVLLGGGRADVRADDERGGLDGACTTRSPRPTAEWDDRFEEAPGEALAYAYDIVCNGNEIGGGSIRIHRADMQQRVFDGAGHHDEEAEEKFGFLLEAFRYGPPPHGGIAFGWDRICMLLAGTDSIREVIAFPKTGGGYDPLTGAPTPITAPAAGRGRRGRQTGHLIAVGSGRRTWFRTVRACSPSGSYYFSDLSWAADYTPYRKGDVMAQTIDIQAAMDKVCEHVEANQLGSSPPSRCRWRRWPARSSSWTGA